MKKHLTWHAASRTSSVAFLGSKSRIRSITLVIFLSSDAALGSVIIFVISFNNSSLLAAFDMMIEDVDCFRIRGGLMEGYKDTRIQLVSSFKFLQL